MEADLRAAHDLALMRCSSEELADGRASAQTIVRYVSPVSSALAYRRLLESNATLRMLRADNLAVMAGTLDAHLGKTGDAGEHRGPA
jgi:hypothetical protein